MLSRDEAVALIQEHLHTTARAKHSVVVAHLMRTLALRYRGDPDLWEIVGLSHDLDYFETLHDELLHGQLVVKWLHNQLPQEVLDAIAAHDHRSGITTITLLADMLKIADVIAVLDERLERNTLVRFASQNDTNTLEAMLGKRAYLIHLLQHLARKHSLYMTDIPQLLLEAPVW